MKNFCVVIMNNILLLKIFKIKKEPFGSFLVGRVVGFEPTHIGTTIRGLNHLTTPAITVLYSAFSPCNCFAADASLRILFLRPLWLLVSAKNTFLSIFLFCYSAVLLFYQQKSYSKNAKYLLFPFSIFNLYLKCL